MGTPVVDRTALKVGQAGIVLTIAVAFLLTAIWPIAVLLIPLLAAVMLVGLIEPRAAAFRQLYSHVLRPRGILQPRPVAESPRPHEFAQALGGVVLALASIALLVGAVVVGWALALIVMVLAFANLAFGF